ncbi:MAG TPA: RNA polymerase sigma factor [Desulfatiglandales bacterium]|nr:RNA polymerase sigma factor [Desulfatiglandales bacterium]
MKFWDVYHNYYDRVRRFIVILIRDDWVADDLVQETFVRAQENLARLRDHSKLSSWIFRIAYNCCQDHFRQLKKDSFNERIALEKTEGFREAFVQKELEQIEMGKCVQDQINLLPESLRTVIVLSDIMDFTHHEISEVLGIRVENVKVRLHRARKRLKAILEDKCSFEVDERNVLVCEPVESELRKTR